MAGIAIDPGINNKLCLVVMVIKVQQVSHSVAIVSLPTTLCLLISYHLDYTI